jgi:hypothetical protein
MEHDDIGQCLFTLAYKTAVLVSVEPTVKNCLSLSLKVMLRHPPIWWYRTWASNFQTTCAFDAWSNWFEDNQERAPTEKGSTFWFTALFKVDEDDQIEHPHFDTYMWCLFWHILPQPIFYVIILKTIRYNIPKHNQFGSVQPLE